MRAPEAWRSYAFGLELEGSFPAPGLPPGATRDALPRTRVEIAGAAEIDAAWPARDAERVVEERLDGTHPERTIDVHPDAGYRMYARGFGLAHVSANGALVRCAPPDVEPWRWQQFLVGRALPWAAVLRGREALHASAVALGDRAIAFAGPTGAGKSSLALRLMLRGARFVTDDVLALHREDGRVLAHAGPAIVSVRPAEQARLATGERRRLGRVLGHDGKTYVAVERVDRALPLAALYFVRAGEPGEPPVAPMTPDARLLLASTFVLGIRSPQRLVNHLDLGAQLAHAVPTYAATVTPGRDAADLAEAIERHATETADLTA